MVEQQKNSTPQKCLFKNKKKQSKSLPRSSKNAPIAQNGQNNPESRIPQNPRKSLPNPSKILPKSFPTPLKSSQNPTKSDTQIDLIFDHSFDA